IISFSIGGSRGSLRPSPVNFRGALSIGIGGERVSSSEVPSLPRRSLPGPADEEKTLAHSLDFEEDLPCSTVCTSFTDAKSVAVAPVVVSPVPSPEPPSKKVNGLVESSGWRGKKSMLEPTATGSCFTTSSSASIAAPACRVAGGDAGVLGEVEALIGVNSSFTRERRLLFERFVSPPTGLAGDIVPVAVCKVNAGDDVNGGKDTRRGRIGRDGIAGMIGFRCNKGKSL
ncbi:MAG: hypothetical protein Q9198_007526, partial [Flavoplaca austrocitrina]